jgi:hypothetical protein
MTSYRLPDAVAARLQALLDRQDSGQPLTEQERAEAEALVDFADLLRLLRLRADERGEPPGVSRPVAGVVAHHRDRRYTILHCVQDVSVIRGAET